ncbi:hypothetical protein ACF3NR_04385 [Vaginella massiliensis]|uniref:hypothetical protein n=1 Tax=Vaginella massiliensis TaxID=1816680 RepID=UPI000838CE7B|nr:hypothetical protein [Vaginella massiliensis]
MGKLNASMTLTIGLLFLIAGTVIYFANGANEIELSNALVIGLGILVSIVGIIKYLQEKRDQES